MIYVALYLYPKRDTMRSIRWPVIGFVITTFIVAVFGNVAVNATCGRSHHLVYTVLKEKISAFDAVKACKLRGYNRIVNSHSTGLTLNYIRRQLLQSGWSNTDFIWSDHVKLDTHSSWIDIHSCNGVTFPPAETGPGMHCLLVNMTSDNLDIDWVVANCSEKHYYACEAKLEPLAYDVFHNTTSTGAESVKTKVFTDKNESDCISKLDKFNSFMAIYLPENKTCEVKTTTIERLPMELQMQQSAEYNIVYVNDWHIPVPIVYPENATGLSEERFACDVLPTTTTEIQTVTSLMSTSLMPTSPACECNTVCFPGNITVEQIEEIKENIRKTMTIEKKTLSSYTRQLVSASDDRTSSTTIGYVGVIIIVVFLSVIVLADTLSIYQMITKSR